MKTFISCQIHGGNRSQSRPSLHQSCCSSIRNKQANKKAQWSNKIQLEGTVLHTILRTTRNLTNTSTSISKSKNQNKFIYSTSFELSAISFEAIAEGNEAWSEIPQIQGIKTTHAMHESSLNRKRDLEPDNIPLRSK